MNKYEKYQYKNPDPNLYKPGQILNNLTDIIDFFHWRDRMFPGENDLAESIKVAKHTRLYRRMISLGWMTYPIYGSVLDMQDLVLENATDEQVVAAEVRRADRRRRVREQV